MEDKLEFMAARPGGGCALGCSAMTLRLWSGSVWLYDNPQQIPDITAAQYSYQVNAGVPCGTWISRDILVLAQDGGILEWLSTSEQPGKFTNVTLSNDHSETVRSLALTCNEDKLISVGADKCISIYSCNRQQREMVYKPAHSQEIVCVAAHPKEPTVFVTASLDGNILLWDTRQAKPASCVFREDTEGKTSTPTAVMWMNEGGGGEVESGGYLGNILIGGIDGRVFLQSTNNRETLSVTVAIDRRITKLAVNSEADNLVAVCGYEETVKVLNVDVTNNSLTEVYTNSDHNDIVRDILWISKDQFNTCSWDKKVVKHSISKS